MTTSMGHMSSPSYQRVIDALTDAGCRPKSNGAAHCPLPAHAHGDRSPSLSVTYVAADGRTRVRCHRGCDEREVLEVLGLTLADLYDEPRSSKQQTSARRTSRPARPAAKPATSATPKANPAKPARKVVARYEYTNAEGRPVLRVLRYEPKGFTQQKHNGQRWVNGAPAAEDRVLYNLPAVRRAAEAGQTIHLTEGEKDADAITAAGGVATTAPMGASKWQPQYCQQLAGARVLVHADRDYLKDPAQDAGAAHATLIRNELRNAGIDAQVVEAAEGKDVADHLAAGRTLDELVQVSDAQLQQRTTAGDHQDGKVIEHPTSARLPDPGHILPMAGRQQWAYETGGEGRRSRGVYTSTEDRWRFVAPLPHVQATIVLRDGMGRRIGSAYLLADSEDGKGVVIDDEALRICAWASRLGMPLSADDKVQRAATTAILYAAQDAPVKEQTPRVVDGAVSVPVPETVPSGYLLTSEQTRQDALVHLSQVVEAVAQSPKLALIMGASAVAPFVAACQRQSHIVALYGDAAQGKSTALRVAGSIWGRVDEHGPSVVSSWNSTALGVPRYLGMLGCLPPIMDEAGQASVKGPAEWGKLIYDVCEGGGRMGADRRGLGVSVTLPWAGVMISAGNGRMTTGLGAGQYAGIARRVVEISTPITLDETQALTLDELVPLVAGHVGHELLERHSAQTVRPLIDTAAELLGLPEGPAQRTIARHLHAHVAGAAMIDALAGTGARLTDAALQCATEYLTELAPPEHDADRMLTELRDAIGREPAMWPTVSAYEESLGRKEAWSPETGMPQSLIPLHGVNRTVSGIQADDDAPEQWVGVFKATWRQITSELGVEHAVATRELHSRGVLRVTEARRRKGEWTSQVKIAGKPLDLYKLCLPPVLDDDLDEGPSGTLPETAPKWPLVWDAVGGGRGSVGGAVGGAKPPLTSPVGEVGGRRTQTLRMCAREETSETSPVTPPAAEQCPTGGPVSLPSGHTLPCVVCGTPATKLIDGLPMHLGECRRLHEEGMAPQLDLDTTPGPQTAPARPSEAALAAPQPQASPESPREPVRAAQARFAAPAAVIDADLIYLPGGEVTAWPETVEHLGHLAALVGPLRLGHGGGERLPDIGQLWLTTAALERLGLPTEMKQPDGVLNRAQRQRANAKEYAKLDQHPAVVGAVEDGWTVGRAGSMNAWTRMQHPAHPSAWIVALPWQRISDVALTKDNPEPNVLADRLAQFASLVGVSYRLSSPLTGLDLIDHTRPPRASEDQGITDNRRRRVSVVRGQGAELPPILTNANDARYRNVETDFSWWRTWDALLDQEKACQYVHLYDRGKSYLAPWRNVDLGVEGLQHTAGEEARWDGTEKPGYYLVDAWTWDDWSRPDPAAWNSARMAGGRIWVTSITLSMLAAHGVTPKVHEAYTWARTARYLEAAGKSLSDAVKATNVDPAVLGTIKTLYTITTGKLGEIDHRDNHHLWRPDWRHHIIARARAGILSTIDDVRQRSGAIPIVVDRDAVGFVSDDPDPISAWPGNPDKLGTSTGAWKPMGSADLATWGPQALAKKPGRWAYDQHTSALTLPQ